MEREPRARGTAGERRSARHLRRAGPVRRAARLAATLAAVGLGGCGGEPPGAPSSSSAAQRIELPGARVFPEGIAARGDTFYVSSTTDGTIFRGRLGQRKVRPFLPPRADGRSAAVGLEVSPDGRRLYVAGRATGRIFAYSLPDGRLLRAFESGAGGLVNDVAATADGDAYVSDSSRPVLWRLPRSEVESGGRPTRPERWLELEGTPIAYGSGFNLNGVAASSDGAALFTVQSNTGRLFRIDLETKRVEEVDLGGARLPEGDGIEPAGDTLYVVNAASRVAKVELRPGGRRGRIVAQINLPSFAYPTTTAIVGDRLLVVNSQFDREADPVLPFTVSSIRRP